MLESYFEAAATLARLRSGPTGPFMDGYAIALKAAGYSHWTARGYLRAAAHLGIWMQQRGEVVADLTVDALITFAGHLPECVCLRRNQGAYSDAVAGTRLFIEHLRSLKLLASESAREEAPVPDQIMDFENWMRSHRGVRSSTLLAYRPILLGLLDSVGGLASFDAFRLRRFVTERAARHGRSHAKTVVTATRMFVRYGIAHDLCAAHLDTSIPTIAEWKLATLPAYISPELVEQLISTPDPSTETGKRDRAILLLLARLGLRAGDVVDLRLGDIDWSSGALVVAGKGRRTSRLPLPQDAGEALLRYIAEARPDTIDEHAFLRTRAPIGPLGSSSAISGIVKRTAVRAGVEMPGGGAHVLRHSLATHLVRDGVPLDVVRTVLRHQSAQTTAHYAKVDTPTLAKLAQPWPMEVASC